MLVSVVKGLEEYNNVVVTLYPEHEFRCELECDKLYCLNLESFFQIPLAAIRLKKIIKESEANIVHSHLFWSTVVARLGTPKKIPLISTIHTFASLSVEYGPLKMRLIEKITYSLRKNIIVAVSKNALEDYFKFIKIKPYKAYALYTFTNTAVFDGENNSVPRSEPRNFRLVTVGNLKAAKNYAFLLEAFKELRGKNISLDIYGKGPLESALQKAIDEHQLPVTLKGQSTTINGILKQYDLFVMSSVYEGFSISVLEAMAMGMPMLLSDIVSFKEQAGKTAVHFEVNNTKDFVTKLLTLKDNSEQLQTLGTAARQRVLQNFTLEKHLEQLEIIYADAVAQNH